MSSLRRQIPLLIVLGLALALFSVAVLASPAQPLRLTASLAPPAPPNDGPPPALRAGLTAIDVPEAAVPVLGQLGIAYEGQPRSGVVRAAASAQQLAALQQEGVEYTTVGPVAIVEGNGQTSRGRPAAAGWDTSCSNENYNDVALSPRLTWIYDSIHTSCYPDGIVEHIDIHYIFHNVYIGDPRSPGGRRLLEIAANIGAESPDWDYVNVESRLNDTYCVPAASGGASAAALTDWDHWIFDVDATEGRDPPVFRGRPVNQWWDFSAQHYCPSSPEAHIDYWGIWIYYTANTPTPTNTPTVTKTPTPTPTATPAPPPVAIISSPTEGSVVSGVVQVMGTARGYPMLTWGLAYSPGPWPGPEDNIINFVHRWDDVIGGWLGDWDTTGLSGSYHLILEVYDAYSRQTITRRNVTVAGPTATATRTPSRTPTPTRAATSSPTAQPTPVAAITSPPDGATVSDTITIVGTAIAYPVQEWWLEFSPGTWPSAPGPWTPLTHDSIARNNQDLGGLWTWSVPNGPYAIRLRVIQVGGATAVAGITVYVNNGTATPTPTATRTSTPTLTPTGTPTLSPPVQLSLCPVADAYISDSNPNMNGGGLSYLLVGFGSGVGEPFSKRTLLRWDLSFLPPGSVVNSALILFRQTDASGLSPVTLGAYQTLQDWTESGVTWANQPTYSSMAAASASADLGVPGRVVFDVKGLVQGWLMAPAHNKGVLIKGPEANPQWNRRFDSRTGDACPQLLINVSAPGPIPSVTPSPTRTRTPTPTLVCPYPDLAGNTPGSASEIMPFTDQQEYICPSGDEDWWAFLANEKNVISATLSHLPADYDLTLVNPDLYGAAWDSTPGTGNKRITFLADRPGAWRMGVTGAGPAAWNRNNPYTLRVDVCGGPVSMLDIMAGHSFGYPAHLVLGVTNLGWLCPKGARNWYEIDVPPGNPVDVIASLTNLPDAFYLELWKPDGTLYATSTGSGMQNKYLYTILENQPGAWRLAVRPFSETDPEWDPSFPYSLLVNVAQADLSILKIETVQVTQDAYQSIPLISDKTTMVRVYVNVGNVNEAVPSVMVRLNGTRNGVPLPGSPLSTGHNAFKSTLGEQRLNLFRSYNFILPASWTTGGTITLSAEVNPDHIIPESSYSNNSASLTDTFNTAGEVNVWFVRVSVNGVAPTGNEAAIGNMFWYLADVYPTAEVGWWESPGYTLNVNYNFANSNLVDCGPAWSSLLSDLQQLRDGWSNRPPNAVVYGLIASTVNTGPVGGCGLTGKGVSAGKVGGVGVDTLAHEAGHNFSLPHAPCPATPPPFGTDPGWPQSTNPLAVIGEVGVRPAAGAGGTLFAPTGNFDFMAYCGPKWVSPYNYQKLRAQLAPGALVADEELLSFRASDIGLTAEASGEADGVAKSAANVLHIIIQGKIENGQLQLPRPFWTTMCPEGSNSASGTGAYSVELQNAAGSSLFTRRFDPAPYLGTGQDTGAFHEILPYPAGVARIVFRHGATVLRTVLVSAHAPVVHVLSPNGGEAWDGAGPFHITWQASDLDADPLTAMLLYSADGGATWMPLAVNLSGNSYDLNASRLPGTSNGRIRVLVTDGVNTSTDDSDASFLVGRKPPSLHIQGAVDGMHMAPGTQIVLQGTAFDPEDGDLAGEALRWQSDLDGPLGTGATLPIGGLSMGRHVITLTAVDSDRMGARASVTAYVGFAIYMPVVPVGPE